MKNKLALSISVIFVLLAILAKAQEIKTSPKIKLTNKIPRFEFLGKNNYGYVVRRFGGQTQAIDIFDNELNLSRTREIRLNGVDIADVFLQPEGGWLLFFDPKKNSTLFKAVKLNNQMKVTKTEVLLDSIPDKGEHITINLKTEASDNQLFRLYFLPLYNNGKLSGLKTLALNQNMQVVSKDILKYNMLEAFSLEMAGITNNGDVFFIFKDKQKNKDTSPSVLKVFYKKGNQSFVSFDLNLGYKFFHSPKFAVDHLNNRIQFAGFYQSSLTNKKAGAGGLLVGYVDLESGKITSKKIPFYEALIEELTGEQKRKEGLDLYTFYVSKVVPKVNGGMALITESFYKSQDNVFAPSVFSYSSFSNYRSVDLYFYNDMMVFDIDSSFSLNNVSILRKKQASEEDNGRYSSFFSVNTKDKLRLIYLDDITRTGNYSEYVFDNSPGYELNVLFNIGQKEVMPISKLAQQTALDEVVVPSFQANHYRLIKIAY